MAGAVFRPTGSATTLSLLSRGSCCRIAGRRSSLVMIQKFLAGASGSRRATVCWIMVCLPSSASNCLARFLRLNGQNRVPRPPAKITGKKLEFFAILSIDLQSRFGFGQGSSWDVCPQKLQRPLRSDAELIHGCGNHDRIPPQQLISAPNSFPNHRESRAPASALCLRTSPPRNRERRPVGSIDSYSRPSPAAQGATPSPSPPFPSQQPYRLSNAVLADARNHTGGRLYPTAVASPR